MAKEDAEKITIPHIVLASNGEDVAVVQEYKNILEAGNGVVETYSTMHHGWMGARANCKNILPFLLDRGLPGLGISFRLLSHLTLADVGLLQRRSY
jgi:hypothetical protein